ncbi:hypothetical protein [Pelagibacterium halotolerans]|uniref:Uncharacterized protein n=1 Tax=Pelagibacterium halotolerans (strain DSM 22347 / JCM 15775 / CGMCC 1.7692 / B2) TaxID=1082931 RepID=G4R7K2_PELHB|nr:hypothetical protein [Pelagibacterium halotolerans]AEQ52303.1 hypothetical protein KKY_2294 [Pelagibacterium halotolerans B2]QJR17951.1 hypothetical protein HKM20_05570 [Pelagibacterium halotolerans]SEA32656.1 hypothetical protein SAMN05428936_10343 [Pelagibacterium halotolerans]
MPFQTTLFVAAITAAFATFWLALFYADRIAGARAITGEEELALRRK